MAEYIDREVALSLIQPDAPEDEKGAITIATAKELVRSIVYRTPTADVAPVVHGRWETNSDRPDSLICSICKCGFDMWKHDPHNYCPNCGAKMDEEINDAQ